MVLERKIGRRLAAGEFCDHINRVRLDNRRENLRVASAVENSQNIGPRPSNRSGARGVSWNARTGKWRAQWSYARKKYALGEFGRFEDAVYAFSNREAIVTQKEAQRA
jgi:hypothetical protein